MSGVPTGAAPSAEDVATIAPGAVRAVRLLAMLLVVGVLLQPVFAGSWLGGLGAWGMTAHEIGANATFAVLVVEGAIVLATPLRRHRRLLGGLVVLGVAMTAVIGLGYVGGVALSVHVPLAVVIAIGAVQHLSTARALRA